MLNASVPVGIQFQHGIRALGAQYLTCTHSEQELCSTIQHASKTSYKGFQQQQWQHQSTRSKKKFRTPKSTSPSPASCNKLRRRRRKASFSCRDSSTSRGCKSTPSTLRSSYSSTYSRSCSHPQRHCIPSPAVAVSDWTSDWKNIIPRRRSLPP